MHCLLAHIMYAVYMYVYIDSNFCGDRTWNRMRVNVECAIATEAWPPNVSHISQTIHPLVQGVATVWKGKPKLSLGCGAYFATTLYFLCLFLFPTLTKSFSFHSCSSHKCWRQTHSCLSSTFCTAILHFTCIFIEVK